MREVDLIKDDVCGDLTGWIYSNPSYNQIEFTMPKNFNPYWCGQSGLGAFSYGPLGDGILGAYPEYIFSVITEDDCHQGKTTFEFTMLDVPDENVVADVKLLKSFSIEFETDSWGMNIACKKCGLSGSMDQHIITRVDQILLIPNPFAEVWAYGDLAVAANIEFDAKAWGKFHETFLVDVIPRICVWPVCFGFGFAGLEIKLGAMFNLAIQADVWFEASIHLRYKKSIDSAGSISLHVGTSVDTNCACDMARTLSRPTRCMLCDQADALITFRSEYEQFWTG